MKIYSAERTGRDGQAYAIRYLLTADELAGLQTAGLVPADACEVVGLQEVADGVLAGFERDAAVMAGAVMQ